MCKNRGALPHTPEFTRLRLPVAKSKPQCNACGLPVSHGKRRVALQRCPDYAVTKVLAVNWIIIPFTRLNIQNP